MNPAAVLGRAPASMSRRRLQPPPGRRIVVAAAVLVCLLLSGVLLVEGAGYYRLNRAERLLSPLNPLLKPSGTVGHVLGITGGVMILSMYLYPLRKYWSRMAGFGTLKQWLDYHVIGGAVAPILLTFHSSFRLEGIAGTAYCILLGVVSSGVLGRYLYGSIPRRIDAIELSLTEAERLCAQLAEQSASLPPLLVFPAGEQVRRMSLPIALAWLLWFDMKREFRWLQLRFSGLPLELRPALRAARERSALAASLLFWEQLHRLLYLWHVVHRPFSYSLVLFATAHVVVVLYLGYY